MGQFLIRVQRSSSMAMSRAARALSAWSVGEQTAEPAAEPTPAPAPALPPPVAIEVPAEDPEIAQQQSGVAFEAVVNSWDRTTQDWRFQSLAGEYVNSVKVDKPLPAGIRIEIVRFHGNADPPALRGRPTQATDDTLYTATFTIQAYGTRWAGTRQTIRRTTHRGRSSSGCAR